MRFVIWLLTTAGAVAVAAWLLDGISFDGADWQDKVVPLLGVALILGLVTTFVKPVITLLSLPFILLTLGLLLLVINALMLLLTARLADAFDLGFTVDGFWTAMLGSVVITLSTWAIDAVVSDE
ncbi:phage holin family protein [Nocardioides sp. P5_C9_2]